MAVSGANPYHPARPKGFICNGAYGLMAIYPWEHLVCVRHTMCESCLMSHEMWGATSLSLVLRCPQVRGFTAKKRPPSSSGCPIHPVDVCLLTRLESLKTPGTFVFEAIPLWLGVL